MTLAHGAIPPCPFYSTVRTTSARPPPAFSLALSSRRRRKGAGEGQRDDSPRAPSLARMAPVFHRGRVRRLDDISRRAASRVYTREHAGMSRRAERQRVSAGRGWHQRRNARLNYRSLLFIPRRAPACRRSGRSERKRGMGGGGPYSTLAVPRPRCGTGSRARTHTNVIGAR